jgi:transposase-like protein
MKRKTYQPNKAISLPKFQEKFSTEEKVREYLEKARWGEIPICHHCGSAAGASVWRKDRLGYYRCGQCEKQFSVTVGTIFEDTKLPLAVWFLAIYHELTSRKGISSIELGGKIGVSQNTAWRMQQSIREAMGKHKDNLVLKGVVEVDEAYIGGKEKNKHFKKRLFPGTGSGGKFGAIGIVRRYGKAITTVLPDTLGKNTKNRLLTVPDNSKETLQGIIKKQVSNISIINTDGHRSYLGLTELGYKHWQVNHAARRYAIGIANTNSIESRWAVLKRTYHGTHHWFSRKHMQRYLDALDFRHNEASRKIPTMDALDSLLKGCFGTCLPYKKLVGRE